MILPPPDRRAPPMPKCRPPRKPDADLPAALQWLATHHEDAYVRAVASSAVAALGTR